MRVSDMILYVLPIVATVVSVAIILIFYMQRLSRKFEDYKNDQFRQSIENQISELTKELTANKDRFNNINHLIADGQKIRQIDKQDDVDFFANIGIRDNSVDKKLVFVLTPFNEQFNDQFYAIKDTIEEFGFTCSRGDEQNLSSNILPYIISQIKKSRVVVANISGRNPNVFYELGLAHALGKPVVIVSEALENIPFDISGTRILAFKDLPDLKKGLKNWFVHTLANLA